MKDPLQQQSDDRASLLRKLDSISELGPTKSLPSEAVTRMMKATLKSVWRIVDMQAARIDELEQHQLRYNGVHKRSEQYAPNDVVTAKGGLWHCKRITKSVPGTDDSWQLMHKTPVSRGRQS